MQEDGGGGCFFSGGRNGVILNQWMKKEKAGFRRCVWEWVAGKGRCGRSK